jgi:hypothetical protein
MAERPRPREVVSRRRDSGLRSAGAVTRWLAGVVAVLVATVGLPLITPVPAAAATNPITNENLQPGTPSSEWDVDGAGDPSIQGYATDMSADVGGSISFKVDLDPSVPEFHIDVYRLGWYGGDGARRVASIPASDTTSTDQPACLNEPTTGLVDCGNWSVSATWDIPSDAVSGVYIARLVRDDTQGASHIVFVVRDDSRGAQILFQTSDTTWQAYNGFGGNSLYGGNGPGSGGSADGRAYKVSYNRPLTVRGTNEEDALFNSEYPMIRWLERNGYDVSYSSGVDTDRSGAELLEHDVFMSVGHDEYWSGAQRANVEAARDAGVNLAFFSGNEVFWRTRWEPSVDGSGAGHRTLVSYKETHDYPNNPDPSGEWTGTWRDVRDPDSVNAPENGLTGTIFTVNCCTYDMVVPEDAGLTRLWRNTSVAGPGPDTLGGGLLGYEWDEDLDNGVRPDNLVRLSRTTVPVDQRVVDGSFGSEFGPGPATHSLTMYRAPSGALVFGAGTVQWPWGLDPVHDRDGSPANPSVQQATVNLLADMGVAPASPQSGVVVSGPSSDTTAPTVTITSPASGASVEPGSITVAGTASDTGGAVGAVEISLDGGANWQPVEGWGNWFHTFPSGPEGTSMSVLVRAIDDSFNVGAPAQVDITVGPATCPCSIFGGALPSSVSNDTISVCASRRRSTASSPASGSTRTSRTPACTSVVSGPRPASSWPPPRSPTSRLQAGRRRRSTRRWPSTPARATWSPTPRRTATTPRISTTSRTRGSTRAC